ncbi:hypothetical protein SK128_006128, partial [Halocaridina rubra]
ILNMAEGDEKALPFPKTSRFDYSRFNPRIFKVKEELDDYMDVQPLDFSTKRKQSPPLQEESNHDSEMKHHTECRANAFETSGSYMLPDSSVRIKPKCHPRQDDMSVTPPPLSSSTPLSLGQTSESLVSSINHSVFAKFHSNPLLLSTLQSAFSISESYGPPITSKNISSSEYLSTGHSSDASSLYNSKELHVEKLALNRLGLNSIRSRRVEVSKTGENGLGLGNTLGAGGLGRGSIFNQSADNEHPIQEVDGFGVHQSVNSPAKDVDLMGNSRISSSTLAEATLTEESNSSYYKFREEMIKQVQASKSRWIQNRKSNSERSDDDCAEHCEEKIPETSCKTLDQPGDTADLPLPANSEMVKDPSHGPSQDCLSKNVNLVNKRKVRPNNVVVKDDAYWERRRKNNEAAKRSRDARRAKEDEIAIRAAFLEQENIKLRVELSSLKAETAKLRFYVYTANDISSTTRQYC